MKITDICNPISIMEQGLLYPSRIRPRDGLIGYVTGDFGDKGNDFTSTWIDIRKNLFTEEFSELLNDTVEFLRTNHNIPLLMNKHGMLGVCLYLHRLDPTYMIKQTPETYGISIETGDYTLYFKCMPFRQGNNFIIYAFRTADKNKYLLRRIEEFRLTTINRTASKSVNEKQNL